MKSIESVYIHIPFCSSICTYCDFSKMLYYEKFASSYLEALFDEVKEKYNGEEIKTIYIGGGTPSVLNLKDLKKLFEITKIFKLKKDYEFTIECNVNDINEEKLEIFKNNGINRISIGVQSFNSEILKKMNRFHTYEEVKQKIELINKFGIENINVDLIYAFPNTSIFDLKKDLEKVFSLKIKHISTYSLMIEPHTMLYIKKTKSISEDIDSEMYELIKKEMKKHGFIHYEVSNFCIPNYQSKHNLTYWNNLEYYGFGLGASGYIKNVRYTNTFSLDKYLSHKYVSEEEVLSKNDQMVYELILGMRKIDGINIKDFNKKFQTNLIENKIIQRLIKNDCLVIDDNYIKIPYNKIYTENDILKELLDYE